MVTREFNAAVISVYWHVMMPQQSKIDFAIPDAQVGLASSGSMEIIGEHLLYPWFLPDWLKKGSFTREQLINIVQNNIAAIMNRYKGQVTRWSVVNEAVIDPGSTEFFCQHIGPDYLDIAFRAARHADASVKLYYNDGQNETMADSRYARTKQIVTSLSSKGLIDAVGLQMHIDASRPPRRDDLIKTMKSYDLPIYITEMDVDLRNIKGSDDQRFKLQADIYRMVIEAAIESGVCRTVVFWGIGDKYSWLEQPSFGGSPMADPTMFDDNLNPKLAYFAVRDVLSGK